MKPKAVSRAVIRGMTLVEVLVGIAVVGIVAGSLYAGLVMGVSEVSSARENFRATQVIMEKLEVLRAYSWSQLSPVLDADELEDADDPFDPEDPHTVENDPVYNTSIPEHFTAPLVPGQTNGALFYGTVTFAPAPVSEAYSNSLMRVQISVTWQSRSTTRTRSMKTFFAQYGMQNNLTR